MRTAIRTAGLVLVSLLLLLSGAFADSQARIVRLSYVEGGVQIDRGEGQQFIHAFLNMPVIEGSRLVTAEDGRAEVEFEDGSTVRLTPNTEILFRQLRLRQDGDRISNIELQRGTAYFHLRDRDQYTVFAAGQEFSPKKSSAFRVQVSTPSNELQVAVMSGQLQVFRSTGERLDVRKNETLSFDLSDLTRYYLSRGITEEAFDYWDRERDKRHSVEYASNYGNGGYTSYSPNYVYGLPDLYRYGSFFVVAGYGSVWQPFGVGPAWDPYNVGYWVWYPGFGYTWVSPYPWGWTPYRYGTWVFVSNHGWCWRPGNTWHNWNAFTPIVGPPLHRHIFTHPPRTRTREVIAVGTPSVINHTGDIPGRRRAMTESDIRPGRLNGDGISIVGPSGSGSTTTSPGAGFSHTSATPGRPGRGTVNTGSFSGVNAGADANLNRGGRPARDANNSDGAGTPAGDLTGIAPRRPDVSVIRGSEIDPGPAGNSTPNVTVDRPSRSESIQEPDRSPRVSPPDQQQSSPPPSFSRPERVSPPPSSPPRSSSPSFSRPAPSSPPPSSPSFSRPAPSSPPPSAAPPSSAPSRTSTTPRSSRPS